MGGQDLRPIYRAIIAAVSTADDAALDDLIATTLIDHNPVPGQPSGRAGFKHWAATARQAFPDLSGVVEDTVVEGDKVAGRVTWRGTHRGVFAGVPATGATAEFEAFHIVRFADGLATEWWATADLFGALTRLGATATSPR